MQPINPVTTAQAILDSMLGYLGFAAEVVEEPHPDGPALQVRSADAEMLIGHQGERLDDIQYLVNRLLQTRIPDAPRIRVDVEHFRAMREDQLVEAVRETVERVRNSGKRQLLMPLNAYERRIIHNAFKDESGIRIVSPEGRGRVKRMTVERV